MSVDEAALMAGAPATESASPIRWPRVLSTLERRVTVAVSLLLVGVMAGMWWISHSRVVAAVSDSEMTRLQASADELAKTLESQAARLAQDGARLATAPIVRDAVSGSGPAVVAAAEIQLRNARAQSTQIDRISILGKDGDVIVSTRPAAVDREQLDRTTRLETVTGPTISPLRSRGDTVLYSVTAPIAGLSGTPVGYIVVTRRLSGSGELLRGLVGRGAKVLFANADGTLVTDLIAPVSHPTNPKPGSPAAYVDNAGDEVLGAASVVHDTPWMVVVEAPRAAALHAANEFTVDSAIFGGVFVILGALLSWLLIRRTMRPLGDVTAVARDIAAGNLSRRADVRGRGEIALLGDAFNQMVERVGRSALDLAARARQLELSNKELNESEAKYRSLFEHMPDGILVHRDYHVLFANPAAVKLLGVSAETELADRSVLDLVMPQDREAVRECIAKTVASIAPGPTMELRLQRADRKVATVEATSMPLQIDGARAVQTILHDVSERRLLEEQFRQSQKMDAVGRLAGGVAHDFNNLLTVIQAHAEFALSDSGSAEERHKDIEEIKKTAENAARLTRQLLTFSRKQSVTPEHLDLNDAIAGMLGMIKRLIGDNIEVVTVAGKDLAGIWADPGQIQQVLLNLAVNARDAMPDGGVLRFETANITVGEGYVSASSAVIPAGRYVMLAVQDTGVGMTEEIRSRVFEPFFTTKQPGRGTGLGLSTVYGIVKQAGGHIWVYSEPGMGSAFKVFFPPKDSLDEAAMLRTTGEFATDERGHLLVVEDDASVRTAVVRALRGAGFTVTECRDADEALQVLVSPERVDLMITDMVMPGKPGMVLLAEARALRAGLPAIVLSGYSDQPNGSRRETDRAVFIEKPVSPAELIRRVSQMLAVRA